MRPVHTADVPGVITLVTDVLSEFGLEFGKGAATDDQLRELPASYDAHGGAFWVATTSPDSAGAPSTLVGTCGVYPVAPGSYELRKMYLRPTARGHRLGTRLLDTAVDWVRAAGGTRIVLDTIEEMTGAIAFYEAHGFVRDDCQVRGARCTRGYRRDL